MSKLTMTEKTERVLKFLVGISKSAHARTQLMASGFRPEDYEEGWTLVRATSKVSFDQVNAAPVDPVVIGDIDVWENMWFPIASATLNRHYPKVNEFVFNNLTQAEGPAVIVTVGTFVERIRRLENLDDETKNLPDAALARQLLERRGLTATVMAQAEGLLAQARAFKAPVPDNKEQVAAQQAAAEQAMWAWYLEWSEIARTHISQRRVLKLLGFLQSRRVEEEDDDAPEA